MAETSASDGDIQIFRDHFGEWLTLPPGWSVSLGGDSFDAPLSPLEAVDWLQLQLAPVGFEIFQAENDATSFFRAWQLLRGSEIVVIGARAQASDFGRTQVFLHLPDLSGGEEIVLGEL